METNLNVVTIKVTELEPKKLSKSKSAGATNAVAMLLAGTTAKGIAIGGIVDDRILKPSAKLIEELKKLKGTEFPFAPTEDGKLFSKGDAVTIKYYDYVKGDTVLNRAGKPVTDKDNKVLKHTTDSGTNIVSLMKSDRKLFELEAETNSRVVVTRESAQSKEDAMLNTLIKLQKGIDSNEIPQSVLDSYIRAHGGKVGE